MSRLTLNELAHHQLVNDNIVEDGPMERNLSKKLRYQAVRNCAQCSASYKVLRRLSGVTFKIRNSKNESCISEQTCAYDINK